MPVDIEKFASFQQDNEDVTAVSLSNCLLMAGFIKESGFIDFTNARLGKNRKHIVNRGEVLAVLLLCMANGQYKSILGTQEQVQQMPVSSLIDLPEGCRPEHFSRDAFTDALSALFSYGHELFFREFAFHVIPKMQPEGFEPKAVSIDTSTISTYHSITPKTESNETDDGLILIQHSSVKNDIIVPAKALESVEEVAHGPIAIRRGHSKNRRTDLGQVIIGALVDAEYGIPLAVTTQSGDKSDKLTFQEMAEELLGAVAQVFKSIRYLVGDSALCTKASFDSVLRQGKHLITRVPDNYRQAKELLELIDDDGDMLQPICTDPSTGSQTKAYKVRSELHGHPVLLVLIHNPKLSKAKEETIHRRASNEKTELQKQLKSKFKCREDALAHVHKLQESCKYCRIRHQIDTSGTEPEMLFDMKETYGRRGRPSAEELADPKARSIQYIRAKCTVEIDEDLVKSAIEQECRYVLACTDAEQNLTSEEILRLYKCNALIESLWALFKSKRMSLSSFYFKRVDRIEGMITMMAIAVLASKLIEARIRKLAKNGEIEIPMPDGKKSKYAPTIQRINEYFARRSIVAFKNEFTGRTSVVGYDLVIFGILDALGPSWLMFITSKQYKGLSYWVADSTATLNND